MADQPKNYGGIAGAHLRAFIERIERLDVDKQAIADDIKQVYAEAKGNGFDTKVMRQLVRIRKQDAGERAEQEAILDTYMHALGMLPLDEAVDAPHSAETKAATAVRSQDVRSAARRFVDSIASFESVTVSAGGQSVTIPGGKFSGAGKAPSAAKTPEKGRTTARGKTKRKAAMIDNPARDPVVPMPTES